MYLGLENRHRYPSADKHQLELFQYPHRMDIRPLGIQYYTTQLLP